MAAQNMASRMYSDIDPYCKWVPEGDFNALLVVVPGFKKEELKAQVDTSRNLKVSGERNLGGDKWCRFQKSFQLPKACEISKIRAKFDGGVLYVMVPKPSALDQTPSQNGAEDEDMQQQYNHEEPVTGVARNFMKQKVVILNVVIASILLGLVLFRRYKVADGDNIGDHTSSTALN